MLHATKNGGPNAASVIAKERLYLLLYALWLYLRIERMSKLAETAKELRR